MEVEDIHLIFVTEEIEDYACKACQDFHQKGWDDELFEAHFFDMDQEIGVRFHRIRWVLAAIPYKEGEEPPLFGEFADHPIARTVMIDPRVVYRKDGKLKSQKTIDRILRDIKEFVDENSQEGRR